MNAADTRGIFGASDAGKRHDEWTAVPQSELECVREMLRCLRELGEGRWPG